ncbi:hypothetical protein [Epilithonimonas sp.]|uniref:hypothetical protein n=1 Tax=Epilithonimonas sp. TaxID=2894511 RepID=UPI00289AB2E6|nr:hypothetical protein [Epilithonimonas sp.]
MKLNIYSLLIFCLFTSCYTYRHVADEKEVPTAAKENPRIKSQKSEMTATAVDAISVENQVQKSQLRSATADGKIKAMFPQGQKTTRKLLGIKDKLESGKIYKIKVADKRYKIQVDQWESDSLVVHPVRKPEKKMKFHKNQIEEDAILEKRFSQPISDIITVTAYAAIGVLIAVLAL